MIEKLQELTSQLEDLKRDSQSGDYTVSSIECRFYDISERFEKAGLPFNCTWEEIENSAYFYEESSSYEESSY